MKNAVWVFSACFALTFTLCGCIFGGEGKSVPVKAVVSSLKDGTPVKLHRAVSSGTGLGSDHSISFTPKKFVMKFKDITLFNDPGARVDITIPNPNPSAAIDLCSGDALSELFAMSAKVDSSKYGEYRYVGISFGDANGDGDSSIVFDADVSVGGTVYTITGLEVPVGYGGAALKMATPVVIDETGNAVVKVVFDLENCLILSNRSTPSSGPMTVSLPGYDNFYVSLENFILLPYAGTDNPTVQKFSVRLTSTSENLVDNSTWYIKTVIFTDPAGNFVALGAQEVFANTDYTSPKQGLCLPHFWMNVITDNGDGSFKIDQDSYAVNFNPNGNCVFNAFELSDHSSSIDCRGVHYTYDAVEMTNP